MSSARIAGSALVDTSNFEGKRTKLRDSPRIHPTAPPFSNSSDQ